MIAVVFGPVFFQWSVHSTVGKSWYWTASQRSTRPDAASVHVSRCAVRCSSSFRCSISFFQPGNNAVEGLPSKTKEKGATVSDVNRFCRSHVDAGHIVRPGILLTGSRAGERQGRYAHQPNRRCCDPRLLSA